MDAINNKPIDLLFEMKWSKVEKKLKSFFGEGKSFTVEFILFFIGMQEVGALKENYSKEEKQDLMHVAVCTLLEPLGYFNLIGRDEDNWPHWEKVKPTDSGLDKQERLLKEQIILYFED